MIYIDKSIENENGDNIGSIQGYIVDKSEINWRNYLDREVSDENLREFLIKAISVSNVEKISIILNVNVDDEYRGNGYGNDLMTLFFDDAFNSQITLLVSDNGEIQKDSFNLISWYEGFGFQKIVATKNESTTLMVKDDNNLLCSVDATLENDFLNSNVKSKLKM